MASHPTSRPLPFVHDTERLDQHFLDTIAADRIVGAATLLPDDVILDIGAGTGILTAAILAMPTSRSTARVIAVEADKRCKPYLERLQRGHPNVMIMLDRIQDIPRADLAAVTLMIANPPFSALEHLTRLLRELPRLRQAVLCVSGRWADAATARIAAPAYGVPSIAVQSRFDAIVIGPIDGSSFTPAVRQRAALLKLTRHNSPDPALDLLAEALLNQAGSRLKDFVRSYRLRRTLGTNCHHALLHERTLRRLQQLRVRNLTNRQLSQVVTVLTARRCPSAADHDQLPQ